MKLAIEVPDDREAFVIGGDMSPLYFIDADGTVWKQKTKCIDVCPPEARFKCKNSDCPKQCRESIDCPLHVTGLLKPLACCITPRPCDREVMELNGCRISFEKVK